MPARASKNGKNGRNDSAAAAAAAAKAPAIAAGLKKKQAREVAAAKPADGSHLHVEEGEVISQEPAGKKKTKAAAAGKLSKKGGPKSKAWKAGGGKEKKKGGGKEKKKGGGKEKLSEGKDGKKKKSKKKKKVEADGQELLGCAGGGGDMPACIFATVLGAAVAYGMTMSQ